VLVAGPYVKAVDPSGPADPYAQKYPTEHVRESGWAEAKSGKKDRVVKRALNIVETYGREDMFYLTAQ